MKAINSALMGILTTLAVGVASEAALATEFLSSKEFQPTREQTTLTVSRTTGMDLSRDTGCVQGIDEATHELKLIELCYLASGGTGNLNQVNLEVSFRIQERYTQKLQYDFVQWSKLLQALDRSTPSCPTRITLGSVGDNTLVPTKVFSGCK
jgi:hypothetical protein